MGWYEEKIEPEVRELVRLLRNNGVNTTCSCGHEMYIESEWRGEDMYGVYTLVYNFLEENGWKDFDITGTVKVLHGHPHWDMRIEIRK